MSKTLDSVKAQILGDETTSAADKKEMLEMHDAMENSIEALTEALSEMPPAFALAIVAEVGRNLVRKALAESNENKAKGWGPHGEDCQCDIETLDPERFVQA